MNSIIKITETIRDLNVGLKRWELWTLLGWNEICQKYRRSAIGPIWATVNFGIFVGVLGTLYSKLMGQEVEVYLPHLILGLLVWNFLSNLVLEGCRLFQSMQVYIKEVNTPLTMFIFVLIWRNMILFAFSFIVFILVAVMIPISPSMLWLEGIAGLVVILLNALWLSLFTAVVAARYHDFIEVVGSVFRLLFFLTPIIWMPGMEGEGRFGTILSINPFYHFIEIFRGNMLGTGVSTTSWVTTLSITIFGWVITSIIYNRYKNRIAFWI